MKHSSLDIVSVLLILAALLLPVLFMLTSASRADGHDDYDHDATGHRKRGSSTMVMVMTPTSKGVVVTEQMKVEGAHPLQIAGSRLPDCSHACGSCSPCRLKIVTNQRCASLAQAETCPVSYRCMCNNKYYPVP